MHGSVPDFQRYELERIAYFSTKLFLILKELKVFRFLPFRLEKKTERFLSSYRDEKVKKVKAVLEEARKVVKKGNLSEPSFNVLDWEYMSQDCPICNKSGLFYGETEADIDSDGIDLTFQCETFVCETCGLELEDYEELELAGMDISLDRSDDSDQWAEDHDDGNQYEIW